MTRQGTLQPASSPLAVLPLLLAAALLASCTPTQHRERSDRLAYERVERAQRQAMGDTEPFSIEPPSVILRRQLLEDQDLAITDEASFGPDTLRPPPHWPEEGHPYRPAAQTGAAAERAGNEPLMLSLTESLQVAAASNRGYQSSKEEVFRAAMDLDLAEHEFRGTFSGLIRGTVSSDLGADPTVSGAVGSSRLSLDQKFKSGIDLTGRIGLDVARLLAPNRATAAGLFADASVSIPLLRGAGRHIVTESLTQAQRETIYAIWRLHRERQTLAVRVARSYLAVLQQEDQVVNAQENYRRLITAAERARRLGEAGRLPEFQVDQAVQDELRARNRWISARETLQSRLDDFKRLLDLPPDARIELDRDELIALSEQVRARLLPPEHDEPGDADAPDAAPPQGRGIHRTPPAPGSDPGGDGRGVSTPGHLPGSRASALTGTGPSHDHGASVMAMFVDADLAPNGAGEGAAPMQQPMEAPEPAEDPDVPELPGVAEVELEPPVREGEGPFELAERRAIDLALANRLDLRIARGRVYDFQRRVVVAADRLKAELTLLGRADLGEGRGSPLAAERGTSLGLRPDRGFYDAVVTLDLPLDRRAEAHAYRDSFIALERAVRDFQTLEDQIKADVRSTLRNLVESRESLRIQAQAVTLAERRVESTGLFLEAGRAEIRDLLDAQDSLLAAQNALTAALVTYRLAELEIQNDMGVLIVGPDGTWTEYDPEAEAPAMEQPQPADAPQAPMPPQAPEMQPPQGVQP